MVGPQTLRGPGRLRRGLGALAVCAALLGLLGCSSGSSARIEAGELIGAEFTNLFPTGSSEPFTYSLDVSDEWLNDRLLSSYESMVPWSGEEEGLPAPDVSLTMFFTDQRRTVLSMARDDHTFVLLEQYEGAELKDSFYMQPMMLYEFMTELVVEPGGY